MVNILTGISCLSEGRDSGLEWSGHCLPVDIWLFALLWRVLRLLLCRVAYFLLKKGAAARDLILAERALSVCELGVSARRR